MPVKYVPRGTGRAAAPSVAAPALESSQKRRTATSKAVTSKALDAAFETLLNGAGKRVTTGAASAKAIATPAAPKPKVTRSKDPFADKPKKSDDFPIVSVMERGDMDAAIQLMQEDAVYQLQEAALKEERRDIKTKVVALGKKYDLPGFCWGPFVVYCRGMATRTSLSAEKVKEMMLLNGIPAEELAACYTESDPFPDVRIVDTSKPSKPKKSKSEGSNGDE